MTTVTNRERIAIAGWLNGVIDVAEAKLAAGESQIKFNLNREIISKFELLKNEIDPQYESLLTMFANEVGSKELRNAFAMWEGWCKGRGKPLTQHDMWEIIDTLRASDGTPEEWVQEIQKWM